MSTLALAGGLDADFRMIHLQHSTLYEEQDYYLRKFSLSADQFQSHSTNSARCLDFVFVFSDTCSLFRYPLLNKMNVLSYKCRTQL